MLDVFKIAAFLLSLKSLMYIVDAIVHESKAGKKKPVNRQVKKTAKPATKAPVWAKQGKAVVIPFEIDFSNKDKNKMICHSSRYL